MTKIRVKGGDEPYMAKHSIWSETCPHCQGRLTFIRNEQGYAKFICSCGVWHREINWFGNTDPKWSYHVKET